MLYCGICGPSMQYSHILYFSLRLADSPHRSTDFNDMYVIWRVFTKGSAFCGRDETASHLGGHITQKQFSGVNRRFQAKLAKSKNMHIIKTIASIPTRFCTVIYDKDQQMCFVGGANTRNTNPRWRIAAIFEKSKNRHISATVWPMAMKKGTLMQFDPLCRFDC